MRKKSKEMLSGLVMEHKIENLISSFKVELVIGGTSLEEQGKEMM